MIVKEKREEKHRGKKGSNPQTGTVGAKRRQALSVLSVSPLRVSPCSISQCQILSPNFGPQFLRRKYGNLRNFYVEIASGYCQLIGILRQIRRTDRLSPLSIGAAHKTGGTRTHFGLVLVCLIDIVNLGVGKQVSDRETRGKNGNSAEIWMAIVY